MTSETQSALRTAMCDHAHSLYTRGYASSTAGNMSAALDDGTYLITPTGCCFGRLSPDDLVHIDGTGKVLSGPKPTKEIVLHLAYYEQRADARAVVHLHSPWVTALSCLDGLSATNVVPPITPYLLMKLGPVPLIPYERPGAPALAEHVRAHARTSKAMVMANHGSMVSGTSLDEAVYGSEELEETARVYMRIRNDNPRLLSDDQVQQLMTKPA